MMNKWVKVNPIKGGQVVFCRLCHKRAFRSRTFMAAGTNYAEAFRLATACAWEHEHSDVHRAALDVFYAKDAPLPDPNRDATDAFIAKIFGVTYKPKTERQRRLEAARRASFKVWDRERA